MLKKNIDNFAIAIILFVAIYILAPFQHPWFPQTADGEYYSARLANFYTSVQKGSIPPRVAPTFYSGLGYPVFNFNYPIPNILGSLFILIGSSVQDALKMTIVISYIAGGIGIYFLFKKLFKNNLSPLIGSLLYLTAPYHIHDIFHRATTGELMMFGLLPFVLITLVNTANKKIHPTISAMIYAVYFLTHNLYTLMFLPLIITFIGFNFGLKTFKENKAPIIAGLLMSMFFWIPALSEMKYTVLSTAHINYDYPTELLSLRQTLKIPGTYERKLQPPTLDSDQPGFSQLFVVVFSTALLIFSHKKISFKNKKFAIVSIIFFLGGLFLINKSSIFLWETFSFVRFMQHPIRLYFISVFFGSFLGAFAVEVSSIKWLIVLICTTLTIYNYQFFAFRPVNYVPLEDSFLYNYPLTSAADNEFDTIWYDRERVEDFLIENDPNHTPQLIIASPSAIINTQKLDLFEKTYQVTNSKTATIIEKTLFFPGWETYVNGQKINTYDNADRYYGLINYDLQPGIHQIQTKFTQNTPARIISHTLTLTGFLLSLSFIGKKTK